MNLQQKRSVIKSIEDNIKFGQQSINVLKDRKDTLEQEIAEELCPFEVDQKVLNPNDVVEIVAEIIPLPYSSLGWGLRTKKIKKDGTPYKVATYAWSVQKYRAYEGE